MKKQLNGGSIRQTAPWTDNLPLSYVLSSKLIIHSVCLYPHTIADNANSLTALLQSCVEASRINRGNIYLETGNHTYLFTFVITSASHQYYCCLRINHNNNTEIVIFADPMVQWLSHWLINGLVGMGSYLGTGSCPDQVF